MSRDWTPRELYAVEEDNIRNGRGSLWDFMKGATWHINGEVFPFCSEETLSRRQEYPLLGRLYESYDELYDFLSQVNGGMDLLARHEKELDTYIKTGQGDKDSALIQWFEGRLDKNFYYRENNDALLMASIQDEAGKLSRFDPSQGNCFWFALSEDKCISVWLAPDAHDGDQLQMHLEQRAEDRSMGAFCEVLSDESYATADLSYGAICQTLQKIFEDAGLSVHAENVLHGLTAQIMSVFGLKKQALEDQIRNASDRSGHVAPSQEPFSRDPRF